MATKNIVPRANAEGSIGTASKKWGGLQASGGDVYVASASTMILLGEGNASDIQISSEHLAGDAVVITANANAASVLNMDAGILDIDCTTTASLDATTISIDGTDDSNITVTGSTKDLAIGVAGGGTQKLSLTSAGTGADAIHVNATAGSVDIDSADNVTVDAVDHIILTTTSVDGNVTIDSAHDVGIDAVDEIAITTTSADGHISLVSAHTAGVAFHLDANADAASEVQIDAGILDIDCTASCNIDGTVISVTGTNDSDFGVNGSGISASLLSAGGGSAQQSVVQSAGTGAAACAITATAGGITLDAETDIIIDANGGDITLKDNGTTNAALDVNGQWTAKNYRTLYIDAAAMVPAGTSPAQSGTETQTTSTIEQDFWSFDASTDEYVWFKLVMPEQYDGGTVKFKFYWAPRSSTTTSHDVTWGITSTSHIGGELMTAALDSGNIVVINDSVLGTSADKLHVSPATPAHTITGAQTGGNDRMYYFRIHRDVSADDLNEDALLYGVAMQYRETIEVNTAW